MRSSTSRLSRAWSTEWTWRDGRSSILTDSPTFDHLRVSDAMFASVERKSKIALSRRRLLSPVKPTP